MSDTKNQIDFDGPQHIDGVQPLPGMTQSFPGAAQAAPVQDISKAMPPQDVTDAAMLLTEACSAWKPAPLPKFDINALQTEPATHNQSYLLHQDLCSLATDPTGFYSKMDDIFGYGMLVAVIATVMAWLLGKAASRLYRYVFKRKERSAEALKARLIVEAAKAKLDANDKNRIVGAAE
jgi:hypothetical protein